MAPLASAQNKKHLNLFEGSCHLSSHIQTACKFLLWRFISPGKVIPLLPIFMVFVPMLL
jgi:hypothetical protein